jgi:hypothetical protein
MRKACAIKKKFSQETAKDTCNAYVVFEHEPSKVWLELYDPRFGLFTINACLCLARHRVLLVQGKVAVAAKTGNAALTGKESAAAALVLNGKVPATDVTTPPL